jgi:phosphatidylglycerophosphate synthase
MSSRIITVPNLLTVFRMVLIPVFVSLLFYQRFALALAIFILAGITDGLDGLLARRFNQKSQLGTILDPIADKLMLVTSFVVLSMRAVFPQPLPSHLPVPFWVTIAVISRDVFILVGAAAINVVTDSAGFGHRCSGKSTLRFKSSPSPPLSSRRACHTAPDITYLPFTLPFLRSPSFRAPTTSFSSQNSSTRTAAPNRDTQIKLTRTHSTIILSKRSRVSVVLGIETV